MTERTDLLSRVRVASACSASWDAMEGDERVRFCRLCNLNVYNLSALTKAEAESLVARTEGRLCGRMFRRADGTILTKDCPVGLRAVRRRVSRAAAAVFATLASLFAVAGGQTPSKKQTEKEDKKVACPRGGFEVKKSVQAGSYSTLSGVVVDPLCSVVANAEVKVENKATGRKFSVRTSAEGEFRVPVLEAGVYVITIESPGFQRFYREDLGIGGSESVRVNVLLDVAIMGEIITVDTNTKPDIETQTNGMVLRGRALTDLPIPPR